MGLSSEWRSVKFKPTSKFLAEPTKELTMNTTTFYRDVVTGLFFAVGIFSFVSGQFILSTMLFGMASLATNLQTSKPARI